MIAVVGAVLLAAQGVLLEDLTWLEAEKALTPETVVVIPLGAQSKEHGPHLKLKNDFILAEYLKKRVLEKAAVVVAPTVNYSFYPAFARVPGSTSASLETSRDDRRDRRASRAARGVSSQYRRSPIAARAGGGSCRGGSCATDLLR
jgi:creatinine amidohydrolase